MVRNYSKKLSSGRSAPKRSISSTKEAAKSDPPTIAQLVTGNITPKSKSKVATTKPTTEAPVVKKVPKGVSATALASKK